MKNFTFLFFVLISVFAPSYGQSPKLVLLEEFSNTGCSPCLAFAPHLDSLLMVRLGDVVAVQYHVDWPSKVDEFYLNEKESQDARKAFYNISGVPAVFLNGKPVRTLVKDLSDGIDEYLKEESNVNLGISTVIEGGKLNVEVVATPLQDINSEDLRLFVAVVEESVISKQNKEHYTNIIRKMLPDGNGAPLPSLKKDIKETYRVDWEVKGFYNEKELAVIAFIQDVKTAKVYATVYAPRTSDATDAAKVFVVENVPNKICTPHFTAKVKFRNIGNNAITSAMVNVSINGYTQQTPWTGNLTYLENYAFTTPDFTDYQLKTDKELNNVEIWLSEINGTEKASEKYTTTFETSLIVKNQVQLTIFTDKKPEETSWKLFDSAGEVVDQEGPYDKPRNFYKKVLSIDTDDCYQLAFYDSGNNGIVGENGNGYYKLEQIDQDGVRSLITQGDYRTAEHNLNFQMVNVSSSNIEQLKEDEIAFYDNETQTLILNRSASFKCITIFNLVGEAVFATKSLSDGSFYLGHLPQGVYLLKMDTEDNNFTQKIIIK